MQLRQPKETELSEEIFKVSPNPYLLAQAVRVHRERVRKGTKKTKGRGEVRGGGKKPWRQKGTGRARHGSIRSPLWVGGGHAHPLLPIKHWARLPKKMRRRALFSALAMRLSEGKIFILEKHALKKPSTREALRMIEDWGLEGTTLIIVPQPDEVLKLSVRNLPQIFYCEARQLNVYCLLKAQNLVFVGDAIKVLEKTFVATQ